MKIKNILTAMLVLAAVSCEQARLENEEPVSDNMLKVIFSTPELEVKSGSEDITFYAYITSDLKAGTVSPIAPTMQKEDGYIYYNVPAGTTDVIFSNISRAENEQEMFTNDSDGNIMISLKDLETHANINHDQILIGRISDFTTGTSETYNIDIRRLSSIVTTNLTITDTDGNILPNDNIASASVWYYGFAQSLTITDDLYSITGDDPEGQTYSGWSLDRNENTSMTNTHSFIPSSLEPRIEVYVWDHAENIKQYSTVLSGITFEPNHHYTVNLRLKQLNVEGNFVLEEPTVTTIYRYPDYYEMDFFTLSEGRTVGGYADDSLTINVYTALPYEWYCTITEGAEYFDIEIDEEGNIVIKALSTNESEVRSAVIEIRTADGSYTKTITVNQKSSLKHRIVMTSEHTSSSSEFYISGENMTVQDPNDAEPRTITDGENVYVSINGLSQGSQVIVEGDVITYFRCAGSSGNNRTDAYGYRYDSYNSESRAYYNYNYEDRKFSYTFSNCLYLEDLSIHGQKENLDLSGLKTLKRFYMQYSTCSSPTFGEGQELEHFTAYECDNLGTLDLRNVSSTIRYIGCPNSDNIGTLNFSNFTALESVNVNSCTGVGMINLTGCTALEYLDIYNNSASVLRISNCSALKELSLRSMSLTSITHDGADALETITTNSVSVTTFDFSNKTSLTTVGNLNSTTLNLNNCPNLTTLGTISNTINFDISNCTSLETADINMSTGSSVQSGAFTNCSALKTMGITYLRTPIDFSAGAGIENLTLDEMRGDAISTIDLSALNQLKNVYIDGYDSNLPLGEIKLPASVETLELEYLYNMNDIDFSNSPNLKSIALRELYFLNTLSLANCTALEELNMRTCYYYSNNNVTRSMDLSGCSALKTVNKYYAGENQSNRYLQSITLDGCYSLEEFYMNNAQLTSLDFTDCQMMKKLDIRNNPMTGEALNAMFLTLPDRIDEFESGTYQIPAASGFDSAAANAKNWFAIN